jgi:hypothetical protein
VLLLLSYVATSIQRARSLYICMYRDIVCEWQQTKEDQWVINYYQQHHHQQQHPDASAICRLERCQVDPLRLYISFSLPGQQHQQQQQQQQQPHTTERQLQQQLCCLSLQFPRMYPHTHKATDGEATKSTFGGIIGAGRKTLGRSQKVLQHETTYKWFPARRQYILQFL